MNNQREYNEGDIEKGSLARIRVDDAKSMHIEVWTKQGILYNQKTLSLSAEESEFLAIAIVRALVGESEGRTAERWTG